jgi:glycosyltransferase involved in cell wall biosynthesis
VIALNEADRIEACLRSLAFCDEILVVDAHSTDATREIAASCGARVIERTWPGHVAQKEFAVRAAAHDWVLCVDADERVSDPLRGEIEELREGGFRGCTGWRMPRLSSYLGRSIRHGTWYPDPQLRLFDRRHGRWTGLDPHDRVELDGPCGRLRSDLLHAPYRSFEEHLATIDRYTTTRARELHARGARARLRDLLLRPPWRFFRFYVLTGGFLEGWRGLLMAWLAAHYVRLKYAKLWLLEHDIEPAAGGSETQ